MCMHIYIYILTPCHHWKRWKLWNPTKLVMIYFSIFSRVTIHVCIYIYIDPELNRIYFFNGFPCLWGFWDVHILSTPGNLLVIFDLLGYLKSNVALARSAALGVSSHDLKWWSDTPLGGEWLRGYGDVCFFKKWTFGFKLQTKTWW